MGSIPQSYAQEWNDGYRSCAHEPRFGGCSSPVLGFVPPIVDTRSACGYECYVPCAFLVLRERDGKFWVGTDASLPDTVSRKPGNGPGHAGCKGARVDQEGCDRSTRHWFNPKAVRP